jgi:hypothetical protein
MIISSGRLTQPQQVRAHPPAAAHSSPAPAADTLQLTASSEAVPPPAPARANLRQLAQSQLGLTAKLAQESAPLFGIGGLLFPDSDGKIEHMAFQLGNVEFDKPLPQETQNGLLGVWGQLFTHMHPETEFTIVCADKQGEQAVAQLVDKTGIEPQRVTILPAESQQGMSIWIRDSMLPVKDTDGHSKLLIQDRTYWPGPEDNLVAPMLDLQHPQITSQAHPALRIDGGNVLSNNRHTIVGNDSMNHTRDRLRELSQDPQKKVEIERFYTENTGLPPSEAMWQDLPRLVFESEFGRDVLVVARDREQPAFHIDMTLTPVGDHKFLVGDPGLAIRLLQELPPEQRAEVNRTMALQAGITSGEDLVEKLIQANNTPEKQADYDATARELSDAGYEIERMPALMGLRTTWSVPYLTYNNCMMESYTENGAEVRKVYLPQYGCAPLDQAAEKIYRANGFEVVPLDMGAISKLEGAIRCSSYALEREF